MRHDAPPDPVVEAMRKRRYELREQPLDRIYRELFDAGLKAMKDAEQKESPNA